VTLLRRGLQDRRRTVLWWTLSFGALAALQVAIYPSVQDSVRDVVKNYPSTLKEAFGIGDFSTVQQYLTGEVFGLIAPLAAVFFAVRSVVRDLPAAEESGRLDVLLSAPVSRVRLAVSAFVTTAIALAAVLAGMSALMLLSSVIAGAGLPLTDAVTGAAGVWVVAMFGAGLAVAVTGVTAHSPVVTGAAGGLLVAMYVIDVVGRITPGADWVRYASVFRYYGKPVEDGIDPSYAGVLAAAAALCWLGAWLFDRRDVGR
jgi:beta-exotoxin I transport system permease protein